MKSKVFYKKGGNIMRNSWWKKGLVIGIIVLFVGSGFVSSNTFLMKDDDLQIQINQSEKTSYNDWWNTSWQYRKQITINHTMVDADLENFPVLITNASSDFSDHAQTYGYDFVFVDETNTIQYNHDVEYYDDESGELVAWVNVTQLSSSEDTILYLYYGNESCMNQENVYDTWDNGFEEVWHMGDVGSKIYTSIFDGHNGTKVGTVLSNGKIGKAQDFEASNNNYIHFNGSDVCILKISVP